MFIKYSGTAVGATGCGLLLAILAINAAIGGFAAQYVLWYALNRDIPWMGDVAIGLVGGQFLIPASIVCWILSLCGVGPLGV
jgi:hypothetical protein